MKSEPGRSVVRISTSGGVEVSAAGDMIGVVGAGARGDGDWASAAAPGGARAAAPASDARFKKPRRFMGISSRAPSSRQAEREQLSAVIPAADRDDDVLLAVVHVGPRRSAL